MNKAFPNIEKVLASVDTIIVGSNSRNEILQATAKLLSETIFHYDWVGFYQVDESGDHLVLGPFVGAPTDHVKIAFGKGVCGQVAVSEMSRIIQDVSLEDNYLSCSSNVRSEVVFPIKKKDRFVAELDIDSHAISPFTEKDTELLEAICLKLENLF